MERALAAKNISMKITIKLGEAEVKGLKEYLKEVADISSPTKKDIQDECANTLHGYFQSQQSALTVYIDKYR